MGEENWIKNIVRTQDYNKGKFQQATSSILMIKIEYQTTKKKKVQWNRFDTQTKVQFKQDFLTNYRNGQMGNYAPQFKIYNLAT